MTLQELMVFYTTLSKKVKSLEIDLKQTKLTYGAAYTKHIKKERHEHDMEFDFDLDAAKDVSTTEKDVSTAKPVSTAGAVVLVKTKTKLQQEQERLDFEAPMRLQAELEEEERQSILKVHEAASSFNVEEWEDIQARVQANEELAQRLQVEEREKYTEAEQERMLAELIKQRKSEVDRGVPKLAAGSSKRDAEEELDQESSKRQKTDESLELTEEPRDKEADELRFTLKALGSTGRSSELEIILSVHHVSTEKGIDIYMLVEKEYPLSRGTLTLMLVVKLLVDQDNEMSRELLRKIFMQAETPRR
ncbi:hypothetical protein Tco_0074163 [Tanacetum coccineum]